MNYTLNTEAAKQADNINSRIDSKGKYLGTFARAEAITSAKGSSGVDFSFKSDTGATADYLTIWTHNGEGKELYGFKLLMAIMTCLRVKQISEKDGEVEKYDPTMKQRVKVMAPLFPDLMNKPVGLLLAMEEYQKKDGSTAWKPTIVAPFDKDGFTASEILSKATKPETLARMVQALRDRPIKSGAQTNTASAQSSHTVSHNAESFDDFADDIPFLFNMNTLCDTMGQPLSLWRARYGKVLSVVQANKTDF